jgi:methionine-rich copper-binding protein CopC
VFAKNLAAGKYTVRWRALADDGHHESGTFRFTVAS